MRKLPSFFSLRAFEAAARHGSFALAADELSLTPSAISHQVRALETYFGKALFERGTRRVTLTGDGAHLLGGLSQAFDLMESSCASLMQPEDSGSLAVHCSPSFASIWLGPRLPGFMQLHPSLNIRMSSTADPIDLIQHSELDVAIAYGSVRYVRPGVVVEALGLETIAPLCAPRLLGAQRDPDLTLAQLAAMTLIDSQLSPVTWPDWFALHGVAAPAGPRPGFDRASLAISAAVSGMGVVLESTRLAQREIESGTLVQLGVGRFRPVERDVHFLCYREARMRSEKIGKFRAWIFAELGMA